MDTWISIPDPDSIASPGTLIFGAIGLALLFAFLWMGLRNNDKDTFGKGSAITLISLGVAAFVSLLLAFCFLVDDHPERAETAKFLTTEYGVPEATAETLATNLFTDKAGRPLSTPRQDAGAVQYTNPATNETAEYRILTNGKLMKLQTRALPDTANGTADETEWTDVTPIQQKHVS